LAWYIGLDAEATVIGGRLWRGETIEEARRAQLVALFQMQFADQTTVLHRVRDKPVYLLLAMTRERTLRLKPQNLIAGLPVLRTEVTA
jgi:hypothetical protein